MFVWTGRIAACSSLEPKNPLPKGRNECVAKPSCSCSRVRCRFASGWSEASSAISSTQRPRRPSSRSLQESRASSGSSSPRARSSQVGTYTFKVTNKGLGFHTFKFCTTPGEDRGEEHVHGQGDEDPAPGTDGVVHRQDHEGRQVRVPLRHSRACGRRDEGAHRRRRCGEARTEAAEDVDADHHHHDDDHHHDPTAAVSRPTGARPARRQARRSAATRTAMRPAPARMTQTAVSSLACAP